MPPKSTWIETQGFHHFPNFALVKHITELWYQQYHTERIILGNFANIQSGTLNYTAPTILYYNIKMSPDKEYVKRTCLPHLKLSRPSGIAMPFKRWIAFCKLWSDPLIKWKLYDRRLHPLKRLSHSVDFFVSSFLASHAVLRVGNKKSPRSSAYICKSISETLGIS